MDRVSEVVAHDLRFRQFSPEGVSFQLPELIKKTKVGQNLKTSFHASFPNNPNLCVVQCLQEYERRTLSFRGFDPAKPNRLLLSYIRSHKLITSETVSRWIKDVLGRVLIPVFLRPIQLEGHQLLLLITRAFPWRKSFTLQSGQLTAHSGDFITGHPTILTLLVPW